MSAHTLGLIICISVILITLIWDDYYYKKQDKNNLKHKERKNTESERTIRRVRCARIESYLDKLFNK